ncbi:MucR family transcriptional regulator [Iodidimonas sp. SYSU 1G8]|uniref:MucR family transcriptional regulator n=1 Tax=Iodidimonas sp. SYSU 1G8 TaxID=3133967 RepID=UPI0031FE8DA0
MTSDADTSVDRLGLLALTTDIVSAHLSKNSVSTADLPNLIQQVYATLDGLGNETEAAPVAELVPAVSIRKSITPEYIICLEDGKKLKMLKRHLRTAYDMSPEQYRARWNLPADYPMVAPAYAAQRKELALKIGLGRTRVPDTTKKRAGRPRKVTAE